MIPRLEFNLPNTPLFAYSERGRTGFYFDGILVLTPRGIEITQVEFEQAWISGSTNSETPEDASAAWLATYAFAVKHG